MSIRMRHTRSHTKNRRSHHGLTSPRLSKCAKCGAGHMRHRMCEQCGTYKGREVVDVMAQVEKREKRKKEKAKALGIEQKSDRKTEEDMEEATDKKEAKSKKPKMLDPEQLSHK